MAKIIPFPAYNAIPKDGAVHVVRTECCEPYLRNGEWAAISLTEQPDANFLLVKEFGLNPEIVTREMQMKFPRRRVLGWVVGRYAERIAA